MSSFDSLSAADREWILADEKRWKRAHEIAAKNPDLDVGGIYRVIRNLEKPPGERLGAALRHGRLFGFHRR